MIIYGKEKEILKAQKRSLAAWINNTLGATVVDADNLISKLSTGVILCKLAKCIQKRVDGAHCSFGDDEHQFQLKYWDRAKRETFFARDNAEMFILWCKSFGVREAVLFESDGLVLQTQPRTVILCLLELSRLASKYGILLPPPIQLPPTTISIEEDGSDCSDDEFLFASTTSPTLISKSNHRWDSGCSSGGDGRSPSASSSLSKTPSPSSSLKKMKKEGKNVVVIVRSKSDGFSVGNDVKSRSSPRVSPKRNSSMARTDTISSRLRTNATLSRSTSSITSSKSSINRALKGSTHSLSSFSQQKQRSSALDKRVSEVARQYLKEDDKIQRLSEGHYTFGDKNLYLRIVRGNNVVVRIGGGWDTLEHYLSVLDIDKKHEKRTSNISKQRRPTRNSSYRN